MNHAEHDHASMGHDHHQLFLETTPPTDHDHSGHGHGSDHDHSGHGDHGATQDHGSMHHMMSMVFHFGVKETILFDQWSIDSVGGLIASMLVIVLMGGFYEGLKYYREYLFWKTYSSLQYRAVTLPEKNPVVGAEENGRVHMVGEVIHKQPPSISSSMHAYQTFLHIIQVTLSFILMLIFMTYNVWLCLAVVIGAAGGYFLFGWKKSVFVDVTEHCH